MKKQLALAITLAAASFGAIAGELSYSNIEAGVGRIEIESDDAYGADDVVLDGYFLHGSVALDDSFYLFGGYETGNDNVFVDFFGGFDTELTQTQAGVGYHHALSDRADLVTELSYLNQEVEVSFDAFGASQNESVDGYRASLGFRGLLADNFEGLVKANYTDGSDFDGEFSGTIGAQLKFNPTWGLVGEIELGDDAQKYLVGVRASF